MEKFLQQDDIVIGGTGSPSISGLSLGGNALQQAATGVLLSSANGDATLGTVSHQLNLRLDRPVEGCELRPRVYLYSTQRTATGIANKAYNQSDHTFEFRWYRGPERQACANLACPRADSFSPLDWSTYALQGSRIQCVICSRLKVPRHKTVFCNAKCFQQAWKDHRLIHSAYSWSPQDPNQHTQQQNHGQAGLEQDGQQAPLSPVPGTETALVDGTYNTYPPYHSKSADGIPDEDSEQWELFSTAHMLVPGEIDVGHCLRLECRAVLPDSSLVCSPKIITTEPVLCLPPLPPKRMSLLAPGGVGAKNVPGNSSAVGGTGVRVRVVSYNLLAEIYATQQAYPYCDFWALSWNYRKSNLVRELLEASGDILCLQEVQADAFQAFFKPLLSEKGYDGLYKSKTRESMGMVGKVDGCALFWRRAKFRLSENYAIEFNECARRAAGAMGLSSDDGHQFIHRLCKDNVAQVAVLDVLQRPRGGRMPASPQQICICNTHLYSNPEFPDVKLWQCHALLQELEHLVMSQQLPLLVCGDFNSEPGSAVYEIVSTQQVQHGHPDLGNDPCHVLPDASELSHNMQLQSAYASVCGEEPSYTNYTDMFKGTLDYIWYSSPHLKPVSVAPVPTEEEIQRSGRSMPNVTASSDHVLLCADFQLGGSLGSSLSPLFQGQQPKYYVKGP